MSCDPTSLRHHVWISSQARPRESGCSMLADNPGPTSPKGVLKTHSLLDNCM